VRKLWYQDSSRADRTPKGIREQEVRRKDGGKRRGVVTEEGQESVAE
jgi:hypothetical protein